MRYQVLHNSVGACRQGQTVTAEELWGPEGIPRLLDLKAIRPARDKGDGPDEPTGDERLMEAVAEIYRLQKVVGERNAENDKLRQELQAVSRDRDELKALLDAATNPPSEDKPEEKPDTKAARKGK